MALLIPFTATNRIVKFSTTLGTTQYGFRARWNARDNLDPATGVPRGAWYFDVSGDNGDTIATGIKIVLGAYLGRQFNHPLFRNSVLVAVDLSGKSREAGIDDLGTRVVVMQLSTAEVLSLRVLADFPDPSIVVGQTVSG